LSQLTFKRFNISKMAPTGYRLYLHSSRLAEFNDKKLRHWNSLSHSVREKFLERARQLKELHTIICETLHIDQELLKKTKKRAKRRKPAKRVARTFTKKEVADMECPPRSRSLSRPRKSDIQPDGINVLRLRSRSLQRPRRPLRLPPKEPSLSETDLSTSMVC
jgi:hypothetical protein